MIQDPASGPAVLSISLADMQQFYAEGSLSNASLDGRYGLGVSFDTVDGSRDLTFSYTTLGGGTAFGGSVRFTGTPIPEPATATLLAGTAALLLLRRPRVNAPRRR